MHATLPGIPMTCLIPRLVYKKNLVCQTISSPMSNGQLPSDVTALESVTRLIEHNMIFITSDFGDCDLAQSWFINYNLRICRLWLVLNTTWFLSLPKKSDVLYYVPWHLPRYMVHSSRSSNRKTQKKVQKRESNSGPLTCIYTDLMILKSQNPIKNHMWESNSGPLTCIYTDLPGILIRLFKVSIMTVFKHKRGVAHKDKFGQTAFPEMQLVQILMLRFAVCQ